MEGKPLTGVKRPKWWNLLTVEPTVLLSTLAAVLSDILFQNLLLDRTCLKTNADGTCATELDNQISVSQLNTLKLFGRLILGTLITSYAGLLIDRNVDYIRWCIYLPVVGQALCDVLNFVNVEFVSWSPLVMTAYNILILGLSGNIVAMMLMNTAYISLTSTKQERTIRVGYVMVSFSLGNGIGFLSSGFVVEYLGFRNGFLTCIALLCVAATSATLLTKDVDGSVLCDEKRHHGGLITAIVEGVKLLKKERAHNKRLMICLLIMAFILVHSYPYGELSIMYLYLKHQFNFSAVEFGVLMCFSMVIESFGTLFCTEILKRRLGVRDASVGITGGVFEVVVSLLWLTVTQSWQIYVVICFGLFEKAILSATWSLASKCIEPEEYGRLTSLFGVTNLVVPAMILVYNTVYEMVISTYPSAVFLLSAALSAPLIVLFGILLRLTRKMPIVHYSNIGR